MTRRHLGVRRLAGLSALILVAGGLAAVLAPGAVAQAAVTSGATYTVINLNSGKCVDARAAATANGTAVQQYDCNGTTAQQWVFTATSGGYFDVGVSTSSAQVWDDTNVSPSSGSPIQLWTYGGGTNQQWKPVVNANGTYSFMPRNSSNECLDVTNRSTSTGTVLQQWACTSGDTAQTFTLSAQS